MSQAQRFWLLLVAIVSILVYFLVLPGYFPYVGISLLLIVLITTSFMIKREMFVAQWGYVLLASILAIFVVMRSQPLLVFLDIMAVLILGTLMVMNYRRVNQLNSLVFGSVLALTKIFQAPPIRPWLSWMQRSGGKDRSWLKEVLPALAILILVMVMILPALAEANPLFSSWVQYLTPKFNESVLIWLVRIGLAGVLVWFIPKFLTANTIVLHETKAVPNKIAWQLPKIGTMIILGIFLWSQLQLYTMDNINLSQAGITHSQRTREVFAQLLWVSLITLGLIYGDIRHNKGKLTSIILTLQVVLLIIMALASDLSYIAAWGLTHKRLYGIAMVLWLWIMYGLILGAHFNLWMKRRLLELAVWTTGGILLMVNFANFDYLIAHLNSARTGQGVDYLYLARLSPDAHFTSNQLSLVIDNLAQDKQNRVDYQTYNALNFLIYNARSLLNKYQDMDLRRINLAEYRYYLELTKVDLSYYTQIINNLSTP